MYGSAFQALPTRGATTPLIVTAVLNSTRAALTRATHSDRRPLDVVLLADFRTGGVPWSEKPEPASPKGDRRSVLSEKEIQESDNCSQLHMGCPYCFYSYPFCFHFFFSFIFQYAISQSYLLNFGGCRGRRSRPLHVIISAVARWLHESKDSMPQAE